MKTKRKFKNKEEVIKDLQKSQEFVKKMDFVKNKFYPALLGSSYSIDDAQSFISSLSTMIMQEFLQTMKERRMGELNLVSKLDEKEEKHDELVNLVRIFDDMTLFDAKELIEGMKSEISLFINQELKDRPLSSLKATWIDEMVK